MRIILKILAAPLVVVFTLLAAVISFLFCVGASLCYVACVLSTLIAIVALIAGQTTGCIAMFVIAFLLSPFGIPAIAEWLVGAIHGLNYSLRDFITS